MTEACSGRSGDFAAVRWFRVAGRRFEIEGRSAGGVWIPRGNQIVLADAIQEDGAAVRHEMLHALIGTGRHPASQFLESCPLLVSCSARCREDAGWSVPRDYVVMPPESLEVRARAELAPRETDGGRWLTLQVSARNPYSRALLVTAFGSPPVAPTFGYDLTGPAGRTTGGLVTTDSAILFFQPFETKGRLFEFRVGSEVGGVLIVPGVYRLRGHYARRWSAYDTVEVVP